MATRQPQFAFALGRLQRDLPHTVALRAPHRAAQIKVMVDWCASDEAALRGYFQCDRTLVGRNSNPFDLGGWNAPHDRIWNVLFRFSDIQAACAFRARYLGP